jgi:polysaccharide export outer membrane protein
MIRCNCISVFLLLVCCVLPAWAADAPAELNIELNRTPAAVSGKNNQVVNGATLPPPAGSVVSRISEPEQKSWLNGFAEMVGIGATDSGTAVTPMASHLAVPVSDYIIGPGDVVGISVWKDDSLTRTVVVLPDGKITFPLLGDLLAGGKTVAQLKQILESGLTRYVADSSVTVEVKQSNSMIIYIIGRVNSPGRQVLVANTNVLQALAMAGGPNPFARKSKVKIFRQEDGKTIMFIFDYDEVAEGRHLEMNIELKRGDVILVP